MYPIIKIENSSTIEGFVDFWSKQYKYKGDEDKYLSNIKLAQFDRCHIEALYRWKNGTELNTAKRGFVSKITDNDNLKVVNDLKACWDKEIFEIVFGSATAIWKIFLMHIINPEQFPIFDMHVYRAYVSIINKAKGELKSFNESDKYQIYLDDYLAFYKSLEYEGMDHLMADRALWAYGKFISLYPNLFSDSSQYVNLWVNKI